MTKQSFDNLMLIGRAGSGKSEFIDFLKKIPEAERLEKYNIGAFDEIDDFPWLYAMWKSEDNWEKLGRPRVLSRKRGNVYIQTDYQIFDYMILKFNDEIDEKIKDKPSFYEDHTLFIEFARGREGAYQKSLNYFEKNILEKTAIVYLDNTYEESMRRNTIRATDQDTKQTVLHHRTPVEVMEYYYKDHDWYELTRKEGCGCLAVHGLKVPFVTIWNMPETHDFVELEKRYGPALKTLWELYQNRGA